MDRRMLKKPAAALALAGMTLTGCVTEPMGPSIPVMPGQGKPFAAFQQDDYACRQWAQQNVAGEAQQANNNAVGTAAIGTLLGAGLGAAIGGGRGAAIGAASGAVGGTAVASGPAAQAQYGIQQRYDNAYAQCMYSKGDQVPGWTPPPQG
jgi:hypothetical protein